MCHIGSRRSAAPSSRLLRTRLQQRHRAITDSTLFCCHSGLHYPHQALGRLPIAPLRTRSSLGKAAWQSVSRHVQQWVAAEHAAAPAHRLRSVHRCAGQEAARARAGRARGQWRGHARACGQACIAAPAQACTAAEPRRQWRAGQWEATRQPACAGRPCEQLQRRGSARPAPRRRAAACVSAGQPRRRRCVLGYHCRLSLCCTLPSSVHMEQPCEEHCVGCRR